jgi:hypothetical protein
MFAKLERVEMTVDSSSYDNAPKNRGRTFRKIILSIGAQRSLLELVQFVHDVTVDLCMISPLLSVVDLRDLQDPACPLEHTRILHEYPHRQYCPR